MNIDIIDGDKENIHVYYKKSFKFIDDGLKTHQNVFVYCRFRISRFATIIYCYLMQKYKWNFEEVD